MSKPTTEQEIREVWLTYMTKGQIPQNSPRSWFESRRMRSIARLLPADPRCRLCYYPFEGVGGKLTRMLLGLQRSTLNPQLCNVCERFSSQYQGGAELEMTLLFADVRGSTTLAETMNPTEFSKLINRFYRVTTRELFKRNGLVEKLVGDAVNAFFVPGFSGTKHAGDALSAARRILQVTGHQDPAGPWIPVGVGVHTGISYVGSVAGDDGASDIVILGDAVNTAARLASEAGPGEILVSETTLAQAHYESVHLEKKELQLKGRSQPVEVAVLTADSANLD